MPVEHEWRPLASLDVLRLRARLLSTIRDFFATRNILEVDTPILSAAASTEPNLHSFTSAYHGPGRLSGQTLYLQTSPEFPMKRLLAAGCGSIYQIAKVFRDGEKGGQHNPEFTLLEWYRVEFDHHRLMDEVEQLLSVVLRYQLDTPQRWTYQQVFQHYLALEPHRATVAELQSCSMSHGMRPPPGMPTTIVDPWLDFLFSHYIEPRLAQNRLVFIYDYPVSQAALARIRYDTPPVAERFELYLNGIELANGFHELTDADEQGQRFERENQLRSDNGLPTMPIDHKLLAALVDLPPCAGVALGIDRLLMIAAKRTSLAEVLAFPLD